VDKRLPPELIPELRGKWVKLAGAREAVQAAAQAMQRIEGEYQMTLNLALRVQGLDPAVNWKVNLETGEISEVTAADVAQHNSVPFVAPTVDSQN
jgi:hypothetical protein